MSCRTDNVCGSGERGTVRFTAVVMCWLVMMLPGAFGFKTRLEVIARVILARVTKGETDRR